MSTASERGWPTVYPHLRYAEPEDAIDWLVRVFGFREVAEGATALDAPTDQPWGIRTYAALDIEGHQWQFAHQIRLVAPEDWGAVRR